MLQKNGKTVTISDEEYLIAMGEAEEPLYPSNMEFKELTAEEKTKQDAEQFIEDNELLLPNPQN